MIEPLFDRAHLWPVLLAAPAFAWLAWAMLAARERRFEALVAPARQGEICGDRSPALARARIALAAGALALGGAALLDPVWGKELVVAGDRGIDVVVCLDVSRSMLARDVPPSRLERARREVQALADAARGDRIGCVAFAGEARLAVPLTQDRDTFRGLVEHLDPGTVPRGGTDLGRAIDKAIEALEELPRADRLGAHEVILVLTDGEDLEGRGLAAAKRAAEKGITVHCVGFGETRGSKIVTRDDRGVESFLKDAEGREVVSTLDAEGLRRIAEAAGGEFLRADAVPLPLLELYEKRLVPMAKKAIEQGERSARKHRFQWPLLGAIVLSLLDLGWSERRRIAARAAGSSAP